MPEPETTFDDLRGCSTSAARQEIRRGAYQGHTAGVASGYLQGNLAILQVDLALDFFRFCQRNPKPCPLVGVSDTGDPMLRTLGADVDVRRDLPLYNVYRGGELVEQRPDISDLWRDDMVAFVIGCSFSFEEALTAEGIGLRHIEENKTVPMYRTSLPTEPSGPFGGPMVVSMRPMSKEDMTRACAITARFPHAHGAPVHFGDPGEIGIADIDAPDYGDAVTFWPGEVPVFWACGVTPQAALRQARPALCITHAPGRMLITDLPSWVTA